MNKKEMARLIKSQSEAIKALSEKQQTLEKALNTILAKNPQLAGEPEPKAAVEMRELAEAVTSNKPMLSGNERIERLLKKQSLVFVKCSDRSYEYAKYSERFLVCDGIVDGIVDDIVYNYPINTTDEKFKFGIPYDQYGNEITEV